MAIFGVPACKDALQALLGKLSAKLAALAPDDEMGLAAVVGWANDAFSDFEVASRPNDSNDNVEVAAIAALDEQARKTREDLTSDALDTIISRIKQRADALEHLGNQLGAQTLANLETAKQLRLVPISNAIASAQSAIDALGVLKKQLKSSEPDEAAILTAIENVVSSFGALRSKLSAAGQGNG